MTPTIALELFNLATILVERILPLVTDALKSGEITVEQQEELKAKVAALRLKLETNDLGSHWGVPDRPIPDNGG